MVDFDTENAITQAIRREFDVKAAIGFTALILSLQQPSGCDRAQAPRQAPAKPVQYQRFVPIQPSNVMHVPWTGFFALDTKTGRLCRTTETASFDGNLWNQLPLCPDLLKEFPD
jgi:hypothetical protein